MSDNDTAAAQPLPSSETERESDTAVSLTMETSKTEIAHATDDQGPSESQQLENDDDSQQAAKRPREEEVDESSESGVKRPRVANDDVGTGTSIMDKLKTETEELIENPEKALMPDPIPPGDAGISTFHDNDVLSGRGGGTNVHPGNRNFRDLINMNRRLYLKARKNDKPAISRAIVRSIRNNQGRFLKKDDKSGRWYEIGDDAAREKTSQALRQRAPEMRKILFDTEREEARAATETQMRQQQQRMMLGMPSSQNGPGVMPSGASGMPPVAMHPGMMYAPGNMAPMMMMNPALFMQAQQQQQLQQQHQQGAKTAPGGAPMLQPNMPAMMMDPYQQAAMLQSAFMANPAMMMHPSMMQFYPSAPMSVPDQTNMGVTPPLASTHPSVDANAPQANATTATLAQDTGLSTMNEVAVAANLDETQDQGEEQTMINDEVQANDQAQTQDGVSEQVSGHNGEHIAEI